MRIRAALACLLLASLLRVSLAPVSGETNAVLAGADAQNVTPFTLEDHPASNPDGDPGGLWDTFPDVPSATGQVTPSGIWGETFTDANGDGRWQWGEEWTDDLANTRYDPGSAGKYDGVFMAGFGSDRMPHGAFDPIWARALYLRDPASGDAFAHVSIDLIGWFSDWNPRILAEVARLWPQAWEDIHPGEGPVPELDLDHLVISHTHNHEGPDVHVGLWGAGDPILGAPVTDGTYPRYERYLETKVAQAVARAAARATPATFRFGVMRNGETFTTRNGNTETLEGMISRNSCRTPWVFDDEVRTMQVSAPDGRTVATLVNWGAHVESLEDDNTHLSSDFPHALRETVEDAFGGVAFYVPGAQGAAEIVGDSCTSRWTRKTYDGETFETGTGGFAYGRDRSYAIGRVIGSAAVRALEREPFDATATSLEFVEPVDLHIPVNNAGLSALAFAGVIDKPSYAGNDGRGDPATAEASAAAALANATGTFLTPPSGFDAKTTLYAWSIGRATFVTAPGELFPEIYWGLSDYDRIGAPGRLHSDYVDPNPDYAACSAEPFSYTDPGARTGRPLEPGIRQAQELRWPGSDVHFLLGYTPDLLGYIVPGVDFAWYAAGPVDGQGLGALVGEAPDPCVDVAPDLAYPNVRYRDHYQETNSAGSMLAPAYTCTLWELLGLDPASSDEGDAACAEWRAWKNAAVTHAGVAPASPSTPDDPERASVRHY